MFVLVVVVIAVVCVLVLVLVFVVDIVVVVVCDRCFVVYLYNLGVPIKLEVCYLADQVHAANTCSM